MQPPFSLARAYGPSTTSQSESEPSESFLPPFFLPAAVVRLRVPDAACGALAERLPGGLLSALDASGPFAVTVALLAVSCVCSRGQTWESVATTATNPGRKP